MTTTDFITIYALTCFLNLFLIIVFNRYICNNSNTKLEIGMSLFAILTSLPGTITIIFIICEALVKKYLKILILITLKIIL
jgi:hypothetical protein